jgi:colanic acid/amylovoran biosynthesis protein
MSVNNKKSTVSLTGEKDLCLSCEVCSAVCPEAAISMEYKQGQFLPIINEDKCTRCGLCLSLCPGYRLDTKDYNETNYNYIKSYTAYTKDTSIREKSTSGGLISTLVAKLLATREYDSAFLLDYNIFNGDIARLKEVSRAEDVVKFAGSKYIPVSVKNVIGALLKKENRKYIVVATPCNIKALKDVIDHYGLSDSNMLFLGLFCEKTLNYNIYRYFEDTYKKKGERLIEFKFKTKEQGGWPGHVKLIFDSGRELIVDRKVRMFAKQYFQLRRCLFCTDKLNRKADISFGDCYIKGKEDVEGRSSVIVRTEKGAHILNQYRDLFSLKEVNIRAIAVSQHISAKEINRKYALVASGEPQNDNLEKKMQKAESDISLGQKYKLGKIRHKIWTMHLSHKIYAAYRALKKHLAYLFIFVEAVWIKILPVKKQKSKKAENIVIVGGHLSNKGAQAMTFTVVDEVKKRFPDKKVHLLSSDIFVRPDKELSQYAFKFWPWETGIATRLLSKIARFFKKPGKYSQYEDKIKDLLKNTYCIIDVSGYALSSQWNFDHNIAYILNIIIAKKYSVPYFIFPQSIGPFNYSFFEKIYLFTLFKMYLNYPDKVFLREEEYLLQVKRFAKDKLKISYDIVLAKDGYDLSNIYREAPELKEIKIDGNAVGIIPNERVFERSNPDTFYDLYRALVKDILKAGKRVYIVRHSYEDLYICSRIKESFKDDDNVALIPDELSCIELECIIRQFDFVIASRYHSLVHAYRNSVPALALGWAVKYKELLNRFNQSMFFFDIRDGIDKEKIRKEQYIILNNKNHQKNLIKEKLKEIKRESVFDEI